MAQSIPKINAAIADHQVEYQLNIVEFEGKIFNHIVSILIDLRATLSYVSPKIVEHCKL